MENSAKIIKLSGGVDYQAGSVVSKTLIDKTVGTITIFAFDNGQGLSEHTASFDAFIQILEGEAEITTAGEIFDLKQGEAIIMPANKPHSVKAITKFKMILTMIKS